MKLPRNLMTVVLSALFALACGDHRRLQVPRGTGGATVSTLGPGGAGGRAGQQDSGGQDALLQPGDAAVDLMRVDASSTGGTTTATGGAAGGAGGGSHGGSTVTSTGGTTSFDAAIASTRSATGGAAGTRAAGGTAGRSAAGGNTGGVMGGTGGVLLASGGTGGQVCPDDRELCGTGAGAQCVDTNHDPDHCGTCGRACRRGALCIYGACEPDACTDLFTLGSLPAAVTGNRPVGMVTADFDGDGRPDVATANSPDSSVSVLLGRGKGLFAPKVDYPTGINPVAIGVGDFNGDDRPDLATLSAESGTVSMLLGRGDGTFAEKRDYQTGTSPQSMVIVDLDADGKLDIATANNGANTVSVLLGKSDGKLAAKVDYATDAYPSAIVAGDLNGDGKADLVTANNGTPDLGVLLGQGDGTFAAKTATAMGHPSSGNAMAIGDWNGDGKLDLAVAERLSSKGGGAVEVFHGKGDGSFSSAGEYLNSTAAGPIVAWDVNHDNRLDLVATTGEKTDVLFGQKDGTLASKTDNAVFGSAVALAFTDIDGDGREDLVMADSATRTVSVRLSKDDGMFTKPADYAAGIRPTAVYLRDVNSDGILDILAADGTSASISVLPGKGNGAWGAPAVLPTGEGPSSVEPTDLNGDGQLDLMTFNSSGVSILLRTGDGTYSYNGDVSFDSWCAPIGGDMNGDGMIDIVSFDGSLSIRLGKGDGTFAAPRTFPADDSTWQLQLADLDVDGKLDVMGLTNEGISAWLGRGDGTLDERQDHRASATPGAFVAGDLNGDKVPDLVILDYYPANASVLLGRGDGSFTIGEHYGIWGGFGSSSALVDLNGDGKLDLLVATDLRALNVYMGAGDGGFACTQLFTGIYYPATLAVGDLNNDKRADVLVTNYDSQAISYLPNLRF
jgi:hypothetical protein